MDKCIFCNKQTNNEYSYYKADKADGVREKITVFACTKCLSKKSVIIPSIITFFFVISLLGNIDQMQSGEKEVEAGPIVVISVIIFACLFWTIYKIFCIVTDKPLSEASAAKKLISKAKKVNPAKYYFTPAENALIPAKHVEQTNTQSSKGETNATQDNVAKQNICQTSNNNSDYSTIENSVDNDSFGLMPEDFGKSLDTALFFEWKESVKKLNKLVWIQAGLYLIGILPGILFALIVGIKHSKKVHNLQIRLGITNGDIKQARVKCKNRIKMRRL